MSKQKNAKKNEKNAGKRAVETLQFQVSWGLKKQGIADTDELYALSAVEIQTIEELQLTQDILSVKTLVDSIRTQFNEEPVANCGDLTRSIVTLALGIGKIDDIKQMEEPITWEEQVQKKILKMYYPDHVRNEIVTWAKSNGYTTSTYLSKPIIKFKTIYILLERL